MDIDNDRNSAADIDSIEEYLTYKPNFITTPWDDRSKSSKIGVIILFLGIILVTSTIVIINISLHYRGYYALRNLKSSNVINCNLVKSEEYPFVARIHSAKTKNILCVGAVIGPNIILASQVCVKSGNVWVKVGSYNNPACRMGVPVAISETIPHDGIVSRNLVILTTLDSLQRCAEPIAIGTKLKWKNPVIIYGRPLAGINTLSRQTAYLVKNADCSFATDSKMSTRTTAANKTIKFTSATIPSLLCVQDSKRCVVRAGDLLIQNNKLYGFASTSGTHNNKKDLIPFANLKIVHQELNDLKINTGKKNIEMRTIDLHSKEIRV